MLLPHKQDKEVGEGDGEQAQAIRRRAVSVIMEHPAKFRYCRGLPVPPPPGSSKLEIEKKNKAFIDCYPDIDVNKLY